MKAVPHEHREGPTVSVVLPVHNAASTIGDQLDALAHQDVETIWEVVVVDNGSTDGSDAIAEAWCRRTENARVVSEPRPGASCARNAGAKAAVAERILFCEADDVVSSGWVRYMIKALERFDLVGGALEYSRLNVEPALGSRHHAQTASLPSKPSHFPFVVGANLGVSRRAFDAVHGFDESFSGGADDVDFAWRVQYAGFAVGFAHEAIVHYRLRNSVRALMRQQYRYARENERLYRKHRSLGAINTPPIARYKVALRLLRATIIEVFALANTGRRWRYLRLLAQCGGCWAGLVRYQIRPFEARTLRTAPGGDAHTRDLDGSPHPG